MSQHLRITLFGNLEVEQNSHRIQRFQSSKIAELLACLAHYPRRSHTRPELVDLLWQDIDKETGGNRLRVSLSSLRRQLEPPGTPAGAVLQADRNTVRLNSEVFQTDTALFEQALTQAAQTGDPDAQVLALSRAVELYKGDFLATFDAEWIATERTRLSASCLNALHQLTLLHSEKRSYHQAIDCARRIVSVDPFQEESHFALMRLYVAVGQPSAALRQFQELETLFRNELQAVPALPVRQFAAKLTDLLGHEAGEVRHTANVTSSLSATASGSVPATKPASAAHLPQPDVRRASSAETSPSASSPSLTSPSLPMQFTRFFGRNREIASLATLFGIEREAENSESEIQRAGINSKDETTHFEETNLQLNGERARREQMSRLVTVTGPGGIGKTRLALEVAARLQPTFSGNIWFVPLADISNPFAIPEAIIEALNLPRLAQINPLDQILAMLAGRDVLLVLDNFEQLAEQGAQTLLLLLQRLPGLSLLITSRRILGLPGEIEFSLEALPLPDKNALPEALVKNECVRLFVDRAQRIRPDFQVMQRNAEALAALCHDLEGLPLALELAAARIRLLTPAQIRQQLTSRLDILANRGMEKNERHRSLRAAIEWSYRLLLPEQRAFFASLSVFRGGWSLEAVCALAGGQEETEKAGEKAGPKGSPKDGQAGEPKDEQNDALNSELINESKNEIRSDLHSMPSRALQHRDPDEILDRLEKLRQDSLIQTQVQAAEQTPNHSVETDEPLRFRMLETLREFAGEQLSARDRSLLQREHAHYFLKIAVEAGEGLKGRDQIVQQQLLLREQDNLNAALEWCFAQSSSSDSSSSDSSSLGAEDTPPNDPQSGLQIALALSEFWSMRGLHTEGRAWFARALPYAKLACSKEECSQEATRLVYQRDYTLALCHAGSLALWQGDFVQAKVLLEEGLANGSELGSAECLRLALQRLGTLALKQNDFDRAETFYQEVMALRKEINQKEINQKEINEEVSGKISKIRNEVVNEKANAENDAWFSAQTINGMGLVMLRGRKDFEQAQTLFAEAHRLVTRLGDRRTAAYYLYNLASVATQQDNFTEAQELLDASIMESRAVGDIWQECYYQLNRGLVDEETGNLVAAKTRYQECLRLAHQYGDKPVMARALWNLANLALLAQEATRYAPLMGAAMRLYEELMEPFDTQDWADLEEKNVTARKTLSAAAFHVFWNRGQAFSPVEMVQFAFDNLVPPHAQAKT